MHELAIAQSLLDILVEEAGSNGLTRIRKINLKIGELSLVVPASLTFCFQMVSRGSIAEGAEIAIENVTVTAQCKKCNSPFEIKNQVFLCPGCGGPDIVLTGGRELLVSSLEGDTGEEDGAS